MRLICTACLLLSHSVCHALDVDYRYESLFYGNPILFDFGRNELNFPAYREAFTMSTCESKEVLCFESYGVWFSVPSVDIKIGDRWVANSRCYEVFGEVNGKSGPFGVQYLSVRATHGECGKSPAIAVFAYSNERGLLALDFRDGPQKGEIWLLASKVGYPKKNCGK